LLPWAIALSKLSPGDPHGSVRLNKPLAPGDATKQMPHRRIFGFAQLYKAELPASSRLWPFV